jgi:hypothetical protein
VGNTVGVAFSQPGRSTCPAPHATSSSSTGSAPLLQLVGPAVALHGGETLAAAYPDRFGVSPKLQALVAAGKTAVYAPDLTVDESVVAILAGWPAGLRYSGSATTTSPGRPPWTGWPGNWQKPESRPAQADR